MEDPNSKKRAKLISVQFAQAITVKNTIVQTGIGPSDIKKTGLIMRMDGDSVIVTIKDSDEYVKVYPSNIKFCTFKLEKEEKKDERKNSSKD